MFLQSVLGSWEEAVVTSDAIEGVCNFSLFIYERETSRKILFGSFYLFIFWKESIRSNRFGNSWVATCRDTVVWLHERCLAPT